MYHQQQQQIFAAGVKKGKQLRALQSAFERVDFQMRVVFREYASQMETMRIIGARIARYNTLEPFPDNLVKVKQRQRETSIIITFKIQTLGLLMSADMIDDKKFVCRVGPVPPVSTTGALPAPESLPVCY